MESEALMQVGRGCHFTQKDGNFCCLSRMASTHRGSPPKRNMAHKYSFGLLLALLFALSPFSLGVAAAQSLISYSTAQELFAASHPVEQQLGAAPASARLERMLLLLEPTTAQQTALSAELKSQQEKTSSEYHHWLTPADFADAYSVSAADFATVTSWLKSQGFAVAAAPAGRGWVEFSGTAAQVERAFQTRVNLVATATGKRAYLAQEIVTPTTLKPVVKGLVSLDGALAAAAVTSPRTVSTPIAALVAETSLNRAEALTPALVSTLLSLDAVHTAGQLGAGESIAIAARSNVRSADIAAFRAAFGLPASALSVQVNGSDPGLTADRAAAEMAASWAGVAAPGAKIVVVPAATTNATDGVDLSLAAIVDQALAHTVAVGYSECEASLSAAHQAFYGALYRQAAAEGIAVIAASGDSGAAACHAAGSEARVTSGYAVNALASTPWNTAVGVAALGAEGSTALTAWAPANLTDPAYAGGGGSSTQFAAPAWQVASAKKLAASMQTGTAATSTSQRLLPDVALPTAMDSSVNPGLAFCLSDASAVAVSSTATAASSTAASASDCTLVRAGGSSASAAIFAGISALVTEKYGAQGNLASGLYALSGSSEVYSDVAQGSAQLWCATGTSGCGATGKIGFAASTGYDQASGLGSVNAYVLVSKWGTKADATGTTASTVTWTTTTQSITAATALALAVTVASDDSTVTTTPTGTVTFYDKTKGTTLGTATLSSGVATSTLTAGTLTTGTHVIYATYGGSTTFAAGTSSNITITVTATALISTTTTVSTNLTTIPIDSTVTFTATVVPASQSSSESYPTGSVEFFSGTTLIGSASLTEIGVSDESTASVSLMESSFLAAGTDSITAVYLGDTYYATSTSAAISVIVQNFTITAASTNPAEGLTIVKGSSGTASFTITALGGFTGMVQVVCAVPAQDDMTCTASPQDVAPNATVTFTVQTFATGNATAAGHRPDPFWPRTAGGTALAALAFFLLPAMRRRAHRLLGQTAGRALVFLLLLVGLGGAGLGCNSSTPAVSGGTPLGVADLTITASANVNNTVTSQSLTLPVNVVKK